MFYLFLLFFLLPPVFSPFFSSIILLIFIINSNKIKLVNLFLSLPFFYLFFVSLIMILLSMESGKELVELYRWLIIGSFFLFFNSSFSVHIIKAFLTFGFLSFLFSVAQQIFPENNLIMKITRWYVSNDLTLQIFVPGYVRSTGFNEGPGHIGVLAIFLIISLTELKNIIMISKFKSLRFYILYFLMIILSGAKGAILPFILLFPKYLTIFFIFFTLFSIFFILNFTDISFFSRLLDTASGFERFRIWSELLNISFKNPMSIFFGNSRTGEHANISIFDSDLILLFFTKGFIGVFFFLVHLYFLCIMLKNNFNSGFYLFFIILLTGFFNPALTDIKFSSIYYLVFLSLISLNSTSNKLVI